MSNPRKIVRNAFYLAGTNSLNLAVAFVFARMASLYLGLAGFGQMVFVFSLTTFFEAIVRASAGMVLTQRIAQKSENAQAYWWPSLVMHLGYGAFFIVGSGMGAWLLGGSALVFWASLIASFISATRLLADSAISIQRGMDRMEPEFWTTFMERMLFMGMLWLILRHWRGDEAAHRVGFVALFAANVFTQSLQALALLLPLWRKLRPEFHLDRDRLYDLYQAASPIWICGLLLALHYRLEIFFLQRFSTSTALGAFSAGYKVMDAARMLPWLLCMAIYPTLSRRAADSSEQFQEAYTLALKLLMMMALPFAVALFVLAPLLMRLMYPNADFSASIRPLQWMAFSVLPIFLNSLFGYGAMARQKQPLMLKAYSRGLLFHILIGVVLINIFGANGAGISYLMGEAGLLVFGLLATPQGISPLSFRSFARPILCVLAVVLAVGVVSQHSLAGAGVAALATYCMGIMGLGVFTRTEWSRIRSMIKPAPEHSGKVP